MIYLSGQGGGPIAAFLRLSDADLVERFKQSDDNYQKQTILEVFYERYKELVLQLAHSHLGDYELAKNVHYDLYFSLAKNLYKIDPHALKSWIVTTTHLLSVAANRKKGSMNGLGPRAELTLIGRKNGIDQNSLNEEVRSAFVACLRWLEPSDKNVFQLRCQGYSESSIMDSLSLDLDELHDSYHRIRRNLLVCMKIKGYTVDVEDILGSGSPNDQ